MDAASFVNNLRPEQFVDPTFSPGCRRSMSKPTSSLVVKPSLRLYYAGGDGIWAGRWASPFPKLMWGVFSNLRCANKSFNSVNEKASKHLTIMLMPLSMLRKDVHKKAALKCWHIGPSPRASIML